MSESLSLSPGFNSYPTYIIPQSGWSGSSLAAQQYQGQPEIYETRSCYKRNLNSYNLNQGGKGVDSKESVLGIAVRQENYRLEGLSPICYFFLKIQALYILKVTYFTRSNILTISKTRQCTTIVHGGSNP